MSGQDLSTARYLSVELMLKERQILEEVGFVLATVTEEVGVHDVERGREDADEFLTDRRWALQQSHEHVKYL